VLGYCSDSGAARQWTCKHPPSDEVSIHVVPDNTPPICDNASLIAFAGSNQLQPMISLPTSIGGPTATFVSTASIYSPTILSPTNVPSSESTRSNNDLGLGLGIGLGVGITLLAVVLGVIWLRRQQRHKRAAAALAYSGESKAELHADDYCKPKHERYAHGMAHEKDGRELEQPPAELRGTSQVHELPGSSPGGDHNQDDMPHS
jgi:hypothetical protein